MVAGQKHPTIYVLRSDLGVLLSPGSKWTLTCSVGLANSGNAEVANPLVQLYRDGTDAATLTPTAAWAGGAPLAATNGTLTCTGVTYDLIDPTDIPTNHKVALRVKVTGNDGGVFTNTSDAATVVKYGAFAVTGEAAPAVGEETIITFTFTNSGPSTVTGVSVASNGIQAGLGDAPALCTDQEVAAAADGTPIVVSDCTFTYTRQPAVDTSTTKDLSFTVTATNSADIKTPPVTPVLVAVPVAPFYTSFSASDCSFVKTSTGTGTCPAYTSECSNRMLCLSALGMAHVAPH